jgi:hypothetical protein
MIQPFDRKVNLKMLATLAASAITPSFVSQL